MIARLKPTLEILAGEGLVSHEHNSTFVGRVARRAEDREQLLPEGFAAACARRQDLGAWHFRLDLTYPLCMELATRHHDYSGTAVIGPALGSVESNQGLTGASREVDDAMVAVR